MAYPKNNTGKVLKTESLDNGVSIAFIQIDNKGSLKKFMMRNKDIENVGVNSFTFDLGVGTNGRQPGVEIDGIIYAVDLPMRMVKVTHVRESMDWGRINEQETFNQVEAGDTFHTSNGRMTHNAKYIVLKVVYSKYGSNTLYTSFINDDGSEHDSVDTFTLQHINNRLGEYWSLKKGMFHQIEKSDIVK